MVAPVVDFRPAKLPLYFSANSAASLELVFSNSYEAGVEADWELGFVREDSSYGSITFSISGQTVTLDFTAEETLAMPENMLWYMKDLRTNRTILAGPVHRAEVGWAGIGRTLRSTINVTVGTYSVELTIPASTGGGGGGGAVSTAPSTYDVAGVPDDVNAPTELVILAPSPGAAVSGLPAGWVEVTTFPWSSVLGAGVSSVLVPGGLADPTATIVGLYRITGGELVPVPVPAGTVLASTLGADVGAVWAGGPDVGGVFVDGSADADRFELVATPATLPGIEIAQVIDRKAFGEEPEFPTTAEGSIYLVVNCDPVLAPGWNGWWVMDGAGTPQRPDGIGEPWATILTAPLVLVASTLDGHTSLHLVRPVGDADLTGEGWAGSPVLPQLQHVHEHLWDGVSWWPSADVVAIDVDMTGAGTSIIRLPDGRSHHTGLVPIRHTESGDPDGLVQVKSWDETIVATLAPGDIGLFALNGESAWLLPAGVASDDPRLSDARTPTAHNHAATAITAGTLDIDRIPTGTSSATVTIGNDPRLSNSRTPTAHKSSHATGGSDALTAADIGAAASASSLGGAGTFKQNAASVRDYRIPGFVIPVSTTTLTPSTNRTNFEPWELTTAATFDRVGIEIAAAAAAGKVIRLGVYDADSYWNLTTLVQDFGTVPADPGSVPAFQTITLSSPLTLQPGRYVGVWICDGGPLIRCLNLYTPAANALNTAGGSTGIRDWPATSGANVSALPSTAGAAQVVASGFISTAARAYAMRLREVV